MFQHISTGLLLLYLWNLIKVEKAFSKDMQDRWMQISVETIECKLCSGEEDNRGRGSTKDEPWLRFTGNGCSNEIEDVKRPESHFLEADIAHNAHLGKGDDLKCARSEIQKHLSNFINKRSEMLPFSQKLWFHQNFTILRKFCLLSHGWTWTWTWTWTCT